MLWKCCTQYVSNGKLSNGHRTGKGQFSIQSQRKAMPKNTQTITQEHSSHTLVKKCSKFSKPSLQQHRNCELPDIIQAGFRKGRGTRDCQYLLGHWKRKRIPEKLLFLVYWLCQRLTVWITISCSKFWKIWEYQTTWPASWEICMQVRKQELELDMEQETCSK